MSRKMLDLHFAQLIVNNFIFIDQNTSKNIVLRNGKLKIQLVVQKSEKIKIQQSSVNSIKT